MALVRLCVAHHVSFGKSLLRHGETPGLLSVAFKQTVAQQLGLPEPPKCPLPAHARYLRDKLDENLRKFPELAVHEVFAKTINTWKSLSEVEKSKWTSGLRREKEIYRADYKAYMEKLSPSQIESIRALKKKRSEDKAKRRLRKEKKKESEELGKPKRPGNAYSLYLSNLDRGEASSKEFLAGAARSWRMLPKETQQIYREKAKNQLDQYQQQLLQWQAKMIDRGRVDLVQTNQLGGEPEEGLRGQKQQK